MLESHKEGSSLIQSEPKAISSDIKEYKKCKLLIVEDNSELRDLMFNFLTKHFQVVVATDGDEALSILKKHEIDLIVSDVMMPNMDGFEFCNIIKTKVETSHIPVILLTALTSSENLISGLENGADAYITKPFDENILLKQIENILIQRQRIWDSFSKRFISEKPTMASGLDNFFLDSVKEAIGRNIANEKYGIDPLADELRISRSQLHRKIKALSGMSTSEFVNLVRIQKAEHLISNGKHTLSDVAHLVGFSNHSYFSQCFKKVYGVSPKDYFK